MADRILIVDDEPVIRDIVQRSLSRVGFEVIQAADGHEALEIVDRQEPSLVVLDILMRDMDGMAVLQQLRRTHLVPVIMLTARSDLNDRIAAIQAGADDYITKPFSPRELEDRIRSVLHVDRGAPETTPAGLPGLVLESANHVARVGSGAVQLTEMEFQLLALLARNPGRLFTRSEILHRVWGYRVRYQTDGRVVDAHVARLREKIEANPGRPELILDVRGSGFMCAAPVAGSSADGSRDRALP